VNFDFSEDQYLLRDSVRGYLSDHWGMTRLRAAGAQFDPKLWQGLCGLGLQTLLVPEAFGGAGLGMEDAALSFEEFGRALVPGPMVDTILISEIIARFGTDAARAEFLPAIAAGTARLAFAHAEPDSGCDPEQVIAVALRGEDGWRLRGRKILVPAADAATALAVSAHLPDGTPGLFLCSLAASGVRVARNIAIDPDSMGCRVELEDAMATCIGEAASGEALARLVATSAVAASAQMIGIAGAALDMAVAYAKQRTQFDRPIGAFQAIKHKCADMLMATETARSAGYYAAWAAATDDPNLALAVSVAKAASGDACRLVCNDCLQIHGGVGFTWEFDVHLFLKRGKSLEYSFGDAAWHRERIARLILPETAAP
jgi:alkylation response protein AidB-like acyl-CoA dehydrogenase